MNKKKIIYIISMILFIIIILLVIMFVFNKNSNKQLDVNIERNDNVTNPINYSDVINNMREEYNNNDIKGVLEIENTDYKVPILQGSDNDYYLNHDAYGNSNYMGSIYLDYRVDIDSSRKLLIYGHNSSRVDMPFKILEEYYDKEYYNDHKYVDITTETTKKRYEIFSVYVEPTDYSYMNINFNSDEEYLEHLNKLKNKSMYDTGVEIESDDEILIFQTCSTHKDYQNYSKKYLLVISKRVK